MENITNIDWILIGVYTLFMIGIGLLMKKRADKGIEHYFTGGRDIPWWLAGISMVATTFAADTPLAVTGIVASDGIAGNWIWWNFMLSGMFTVFMYAKMWHRAGVTTDVEFIELRYSGTPAKILRGFRALYLAFPINCLILGWVTVGMAKVITVVTGAPQWQVILLLYILTTIYIAVSGIWGVVVTDFIQFFVAMTGSIILMFYAIDHVNGIQGLITGLTERFGDGHHYLDFSPIGHPTILISTALVWIGMQWWASWYPGAEPGGGGYIAQRMFSTPTNKDAVKSTLFFNIAHYALRPWPWIIVALVSLVVYPDLKDAETGYPLLMIKLLPSGLLGLLLVAFLSAFMSTVSTHLNWGASYVVNDFYARFIRPKDRFQTEEYAQSHYVFVSRIATVIMMVTAISVSYFFDSVKGGWEFMLSLGAGTGLVYMLRWYWWRINAWSEISAMSMAFIGSILAQPFGFDSFDQKMIFTTVLTTITWLVVTFLTKPEKDEILQSFFNKVKPAGSGWRQFSNGEFISIIPSLINVILGVCIVMSFLFGIGSLILFNTIVGIGLILTGLFITTLLVKRI